MIVFAKCLADQDAAMMFDLPMLFSALAGASIATAVPLIHNFWKRLEAEDIEQDM